MYFSLDIIRFQDFPIFRIPFYPTICSTSCDNSKCVSFQILYMVYWYRAHGTYCMNVVHEKNDTDWTAWGTAWEKNNTLHFVVFPLCHLDTLKVVIKCKMWLSHIMRYIHGWCSAKAIKKNVGNLRLGSEAIDSLFRNWNEKWQTYTLHTHMCRAVIEWKILQADKPKGASQEMNM